MPDPLPNPKDLLKPSAPPTDRCPRCEQEECWCAEPWESMPPTERNFWRSLRDAEETPPQEAGEA